MTIAERYKIETVDSSVLNEANCISAAREFSTHLEKQFKQLSHTGAVTQSLLKTIATGDHPEGYASVEIFKNSPITLTGVMRGLYSIIYRIKPNSEAIDFESLTENTFTVLCKCYELDPNFDFNFVYAYDAADDTKNVKNNSRDFIFDLLTILVSTENKAALFSQIRDFRANSTDLKEIASSLREIQ